MREPEQKITPPPAVAVPVKSPSDAAAPGKSPGRWRGAMGIALEGLISLSLALLCFLAFLWVLNIVFPSSVGLRRNLVFDGGAHRDTWGLEQVPTRPRPAAAVLRVISNDVRTRTSEQIAWGPAHTDGALHEGDAVQTTRDGQATLRFSDGSALQLGRNSLLVVRRPDQESSGRRSFQVPQGELWGTLPVPQEGEGEVSVNTPSAVVRVGTAPGSATKADFKVSVGPDRSSIVAVYQGSASVTSGSQTQEVRANQFVAVDSLGGQTAPSRLPDAPVLAGPADRARFVYRDPPPKLTFQWAPVAGASEYRLVVASDPAFQSIVLDRRLTTPSLEFGRLAMGHYLWRVSTIRDRVEGRPSSALALDIVRDGTPPRLVVKFPEGVVQSDRCTVTGTSDADSRVFVAGQPATVQPDGSFTCLVRLKRGLNVVVVESLDPTGNAAYSSTILEARY